MREKNLALSLAKRVQARLNESGKAKALLTRSKDTLVHLSDRVDWANERKPEVFVSIHANSMPTAKGRKTVEGIETYFLSANASGDEAKRVAARENAEARNTKEKVNDTLSVILADLQRSEAHVDSSRLAYVVHDTVLKATSAADRGVQQAPFFVLMGVEAPAILVEVGFISHPEESQKLADAAYQDTLALALSDGILTFLEEMSARDAKARK